MTVKRTMNSKWNISASIKKAIRSWDIVRINSAMRVVGIQPVLAACQAEPDSLLRWDGRLTRMNRALCQDGLACLTEQTKCSLPEQAGWLAKADWPACWYTGCPSAFPRCLSVIPYITYRKKYNAIYRGCRNRQPDIKQASPLLYAEQIGKRYTDQE